MRRAYKSLTLLVTCGALFQASTCVTDALFLQIADLGIRTLISLLLGAPI